MKRLTLLWANFCLARAERYRDAAWADPRKITDWTCGHYIKKKYEWYARYDSAIAKVAA